MLTMLRTPALKDLIVIATKADWELKVVDVVARLDLREQRGRRLQIPGSTVELL
jgi:hypothetical protein